MSERSCSGPHILHLYLESWYWRTSSGSTWGMPRGVVRIYSVDFAADGAFLGVGSGSTNTTNSLATCFSALLHLFLLSLYPRPPYPIWTMSKKKNLLLYTIKDVSKDNSWEGPGGIDADQSSSTFGSCESIKKGSLKHVCPTLPANFHAFSTPFRTTNCQPCGFVTIFTLIQISWLRDVFP